MSKTAKLKLVESSGIQRELDIGVQLHSLGRLDEAEARYRAALGADPRHPGALRLMGLLCYTNKCPDQAIEFMRRAIAQDPNFAEAHNNLGQLYAEKKEFQLAVHHYGEAARLKPSDKESLIEQARILCDEVGDPAGALAIYDRLVRIASNDARAHRGRGKCLAALGRRDEAARAMKRAVKVAPDDPLAAFHQATILVEIGRREEALEAFERAHALDPKDHDILLGFANLVRDMGDKQRAVDLFTRAIEVKPDFAEAYSNLGNILTDEAMLDEAIAAARRATALKPDLFQAWNNLGSALQTAFLPAEAIEAYAKGLAIRPNDDAMLWNLSLCLLALGRIEDGWDIHGYGFASGQRIPFRPFPGLIWQGESLADKTIMITREQGIGDDIRFSTCFPDIIAEAKHVIIETADKLVPLYQRTWPEATVRAETGLATGLIGRQPEVIDFDVTAPAGVVASLRRRSLAAFPKVCRPLVADPAKREAARAWLASLGPGPKIGLTWRSGLRNPVRDIVATEPRHWAKLAEIEGAKIVNLQFGKPEEEIRALAETHGITIHEMPGLDTHNDLDGTAALTAELDLVTGLWNAATEMAGALGVPGVIYMHANHPMQLGTGTLPWHPGLKVHSVMPGFDRETVTRNILDDIRAALSARG
jgi:tetratricopeptide (TPR) repeat protein